MTDDIRCPKCKKYSWSKTIHNDGTKEVGCHCSNCGYKEMSRKMYKVDIQFFIPFNGEQNDLIKQIHSWLRNLDNEKIIPDGFIRNTFWGFEINKIKDVTKKLRKSYDKTQMG